jgi:kojibiose phosphorylase
MMETKNTYYLESIESLTPEDLLPGARRFLEETRQSGVKIAVGSASKNALQVIERLGIEGLIDVISDGYSVQNQKPAPDLFLHAASQLGIPPENCAVFEDAESGVQAALAGGMWAVGLGPIERVGAAHVVANNLADTCWTCIVDRLRLVQVIPVMLATASDGGHEFTQRRGSI